MPPNSVSMSGWSACVMSIQNEQATTRPLAFEESRQHFVGADIDAQSAPADRRSRGCR